jgi:hypothetical protein
VKDLVMDVAVGLQPVPYGKSNNHYWDSSSKFQHFRNNFRGKLFAKIIAKLLVF